MEKMMSRKRVIGVLAGLMILAGFLLMCSEPAPGEEVSMGSFIMGKAIGFGLFGCGIWLAKGKG